jgi:hypothetical protein
VKQPCNFLERVPARVQVTGLYRRVDSTYYIIFIYLNIALKRQFSHHMIELPRGIHPLIWLMAWFVVIASLVFISAWIIILSITRGSLSISQWGWQCTN